MKRNPPYKTNWAASLVVLLLSALYLLFSVGILKATHYCQGREASTAYFTAESERCACSLFAKAGEDLCCDDQRDLLKLEVSQKTFTAFEMPSPALPFLCAVYTRSRASDAHQAVTFSPEIEQARRPPKVLFEIHCSFVFYDTGIMR